VYREGNERVQNDRFWYPDDKTLRAIYSANLQSWDEVDLLPNDTVIGPFFRLGILGRIQQALHRDPFGVLRAADSPSLFGLEILSVLQSTPVEMQEVICLSNEAHRVC